MLKKSVLLLSFVFSFALTNQLFPQSQSNDFGVSASVGFNNKIIFHYNFSNRFQTGITLGNFLYGDAPQTENLGIIVKYLFSDKSLSGYAGVAGSFLFTGSTGIYLHIPLGLQKFVTKDFAVFGGFNPGVLLFSGTAFILGVELGAGFYF